MEVYKISGKVCEINMVEMLFWFDFVYFKIEILWFNVIIVM